MSSILNKKRSTSSIYNSFPSLITDIASAKKLEFLSNVQSALSRPTFIITIKWRQEHCSHPYILNVDGAAKGNSGIYAIDLFILLWGLSILLSHILWAMKGQIIEERC